MSGEVADKLAKKAGMSKRNDLFPNGKKHDPMTNWSGGSEEGTPDLEGLKVSGETAEILAKKAGDSYSIVLRGRTTESEGAGGTYAVRKYGISKSGHPRRDRSNKRNTREESRNREVVNGVPPSSLPQPSRPIRASV